MRMLGKWMLRGGVALAGVVLTAPVQAESWLIRDALIVDGTGAAARTGSVRVEDDRIVAVGAIVARPDEKIVEAKGLVLAPGFIDTHAHYDFDFDNHPHALAAVSQGITTIIVGQDGFSNFPLSTFHASLRARPVSVNIASYTGHNSIRAAAMGEDYRRTAIASEKAAMERALRDEMANGALGLSTGLEYDPGIYSDYAEVRDLAATAASLGGRYISHIRSEDRQLEPAIDEIIRIGRDTGMPVQISHFKIAMKSKWGSAPALLAKLDRARAEGVNITADVYPYQYWASVMEVLLPDRNFGDLQAVEFLLAELAPADGLTLALFPADRAVEGKTVAEVAKERGQTPAATYLALLNQSKEWQVRHPGDSELIIGRSMDEGDLRALMQWPHSNFSTDGAPEGHPRGYGSYPRILGHYVRDEGLMPLEEAVRKMTSLAAAHMGLVGLGTIAEGTAADLVLFDRAAIIDRATVRDRTRLSEGVRKVWVNGVLVFEDGKPTEARPGRILRRQDAPGDAGENGTPDRAAKRPAQMRAQD